MRRPGGIPIMRSAAGLSKWLIESFLSFLRLAHRLREEEEAEGTSPTDPVIDVNRRKVTFCFHAPAVCQHHRLHQRWVCLSYVLLYNMYTLCCFSVRRDFSLKKHIWHQKNHNIQMWFFLLLLPHIHNLSSNIWKQGNSFKSLKEILLVAHKTR